MRREKIDNLEEDLRKYKKMSDIAERVVELSTGKRELNSDDGDMIEFFKDKEKIDALRNKLENNEHLNRYFSYILSLDKEKETQKLLDRMKNARKQRRLLFLKKVSSVAAVFVLSFFIYYSVDRISDHDISFSYNIEESNDVPKIILADGKQIDLEHAEDDKKQISENNISIVNRGKVKYVSETTTKNMEVQYNKILVPSKYTYIVELADGTVVTLNANSNLKYPVDFTGDARSVELNGEAYFKVAKSDKPFIVKVGDCSVKVYGTEFNVNMNKRNIIETTLVEGSISFTGTNNAEIMMRPNQMIRMNKMNHDIELKEVDTEKGLGWKKGLFFYEQEKLVVFLDEIALWYGVKFNVTNKLIEDIEISINVDRNIPLPDLLDIMGNMLDIKIINEGGKIFSII